MASVESFQRGFHEKQSLRGFFTGVVETGSGVDASSARHEDLSFILRVEIDEHVATHEPGLQAEGAGEAGLLVDGEEALQRTVLDIVAVEHGQFHGHADAVVGTEGGAFGLQPLAVDIGLYGVVIEVDVHVDEFLAHHVHVALQHHLGTVLVARGGGLADEHIAGVVYLRFQSMALAEFLQEGNHPLFML